MDLFAEVISSGRALVQGWGQSPEQGSMAKKKAQQLPGQLQPPQETAVAALAAAADEDLAAAIRCV